MGRSTWTSATTVSRIEGLRHLLRLAAGAAVLCGLASVGATPAGAETLECDSIRRLSDNYLLDLRIRFVFDVPRGHYRRFEDGGRGWEEVRATGRFSKGPGGRVILEDDEFVTAYLERLTGAYYYIDRSGVTLSVWGHCGVSGPPNPVF